jgi:hypothetical protein
VAFRGCSGLANIEVDPNNLTYTSVGGCLYDKNQTTLIQCPAGKSGSYTIPNSVTSIGNEAFANCSGLTSVTIGSGVTSIGYGAFAGCSGLANIEVDPNNKGCNNLTYTSVGGVLYNKAQTTLILCPAGKSGSVTIPNSVTSIGNEAFANCSGLTSVTIGSGVTTIRDFAFYGSSSLTHLVFTGNAPTLEEESFFGVPIGATVRYSSATTGWGATFGGLTAVADYLDVLTYSTANNQVTITGYTGTGGVVIIPASIDSAPVTAIGENTFLGRSSLLSVTIPNSVTSVGSQAFRGCTSLTSVTIPDSLMSIGAGAFSFCPNLTSVTIPGSVTSIGNRAFESCGLTSVTIPNSVTSIGDYTFSGCSGMTSVTIPNSVTSIGNGAFAYCSSLTSVMIPNSVTSIGLGAFYGCSGLASVTIPDNVTTIGYNAFNGCSNLVSLSIGSGISSIGNEAFAFCSGLTRVMIPVATVLGFEAFPSTTTILRYLSEAQLTSRDSQQNAAGRVLGQADVTSAPASYSLYTAAQHTANYSSGQAAGRTAGQADVTSDPNTYGLYNLSQVQALNVDAPLLARDAVSKKFKLTVKAKKSTDLVNFSDMPFVSADSTINSNGEMEFEFTSPDNAAFFRIESR